MAKFSAIGSFYFHLTLITFGLILFTILKNFDFVNYRDSPALTTTQVNFIWLFLIIGVSGVLAFLLNGYFIKTPKHYTRVGVAVVFIIIGLGAILGMLFHDSLVGNNESIGFYEMLGIMFGSFIIIVGSLAYISIKFPDTTRIKYFKEAVKEEIRKRGEYEHNVRVWQTQLKKQKRIEERKVKHVKAKKAGKQPIPVKVASQEVQELKELVMTPVEDVAVVKCAKCQRSLKLTSTERPLTIKCPYCEAIGVIRE